MDKYDEKLRCSICGKFLANKELGKTVMFDFIPDTPFNEEVEKWTHFKCLEKNEER